MIMILTAAGCGSDGASGRNANPSTGVDEVLAAGMAEEDAKSGSTVAFEEVAPEEKIAVPEPGVQDDAPTPEAIDASAVAAEGIDVDLTTLSSTMVYSEVYNMMVYPEEYIGKTVKMEGAFSYYHDVDTGRDYYACIIADATACCAQGIEFELTDDYQYPEDYPAAGGDICVAGVFDTYREGEYLYCTLRDAKIV